MGRALRVMAVALGMVAAWAPPAQAAGPIGPLCFKLDPFPNIVVWFLNGPVGNQFTGSGRDLQENASQVVTGFLTANPFGGSTFVATFATAAGSTANSVPYVASAEINVFTLGGPGRFTNLRPDGATTGTFTMSFVPNCPAASLAQAEQLGKDAQAAASPFTIPEPAARPPADERRVSQLSAVAP